MRRRRPSAGKYERGHRVDSSWKNIFRSDDPLQRLTEREIKSSRPSEEPCASRTGFSRLYTSRAKNPRSNSARVCSATTGNFLSDNVATCKPSAKNGKHFPKKDLLHSFTPPSRSPSYTSHGPGGSQSLTS